MPNAIELIESKVTEKTIKDYLFSSGTELSPQQQSLFLNLAMRLNLDPFKREIHPIKMGSELTIVVGYEVYLKRAEASTQWDGEGETIFSGELREEEIDKEVWEGERGYRRKVSRKVKVLRGDLYCTMKVYRKDMAHPITKTIYFNEYTKDNAIWLEKPHTMLEKVCTAQLYRKAFPNELAGIPYTADELIDLENTSAKIIEPKPEPDKLEDPPPPSNGKSLEDHQRMVKAAVKNLGYTNDRDQLEALQFILNNPCVPNFEIPKEECYRFWSRMEVLEGVKHPKGHKRSAQEYQAIRNKIEEIKRLGESADTSLEFNEYETEDRCDP